MTMGFGAGVDFGVERLCGPEASAHAFALAASGPGVRVDVGTTARPGVAVEVTVAAPAPMHGCWDVPIIGTLFKNKVSIKNKVPMRLKPEPGSSAMSLY